VGLPRPPSFSPDGRTLATGGLAGEVDLWDVSAREHPRFRATLSAGVPRGLVVDLALPVQPGVSTVAVSVSPVGGLFAVAHTDDTVRIWDVAQANAPRLVTELRTGSQPRDVAFSPDGTMLAVGLDSSVKLWSMSQPRQPQEASTLRARTGTLAVAVSRGSAMLAAIGNSRQGPHRSLQLWHTDTARMADRICGVAWPRLTRSDWERHFPGVPFQPPCP